MSVYTKDIPARAGLEGRADRDLAMGRHVAARKQQAAAPARAPQPLPDSLPPVAAFDPAMLPDSLRGWCVDAAEGLGVPLDFLAVPAIVACAAAIGRVVAVRPKVVGAG